MDEFLVLSLIAGIGVALVAGPLGCFVVWRRMSYFGATLSHSALLGVALGILLDTNAMAGIIAICLGVALILTNLEQDPRFAADTILGILAHGALALGLVVISFMETARLDLMGYLFGDILSDLGPGVTGTIGVAPSANINPEGKHPSMFEPVHGSAPDIAGKGIANPIGQIWSASMMLDHLGQPEAGAAILEAVQNVLKDPSSPKTPDMGGKATTSELGQAIVDAL